jgi:alpha-galactosidase
MVSIMRYFKVLLAVFSIIGFGVKAQSTEPDQFQNILCSPDSIVVTTEGGSFELQPEGESQWRGGGVTVTTRVKRDGLRVQLYAPAAAVKNLRLRWRAGLAPDWKYLGDAWERAYGDLEWKALDANRVMPWYFLASNGQWTHGYGVETGASALCHWTAGPTNITLDADVRCGGSGVQLAGRTLEVCTVVSRRGQPGETPFSAAGAFCKQMCPHPRLPQQPVYGFNDWYCTYGGDTAEAFLKDTAFISSLAVSRGNRPFAVVDDGWELDSAKGNPWGGINPDFSRTLTMPEFAKSIRALGARPGLWFRPLLASAGQPLSWRLARDTNSLDPSVPAVRAYVKATVRQFRQSGFALIKHDFSTFDLLGSWGFQMGDTMTPDGWAFADRSRTTAEIIRDLYRDIREAAGDDTLILGCNTIGHLSAGLFELQRIGDDTSGREWDRTRKMGVNCLAFRLPQQNAFFDVDADCVGQVSTNSVPWSKNSQWLDLLSHSGTAVFFSFTPEQTTPEQRQALAEALNRAGAPQVSAEPLNWMDSRTPTLWRWQGDEHSFSW